MDDDIKKILKAFFITAILFFIMLISDKHFSCNIL